MEATADNQLFAPPPEPAAFRGFALAVLAHLLLMAALTWGIHWNRDTTPIAEAELWSSIPEQAAPPPAPPQAVTPPPPPVQQAAPPPPVPKPPDINVEREKKQREELLRRQQEEEQRKLDAKRKQDEERREAERRQREEQQAKAAKEKAEKDKRALDEKKREQLRQEQIRRMQELAGSGSPGSSGTGKTSKGPSASYAGRIAGKIKPNIVFMDVISGNPAAVVHLRIAPDGTIVGTKLVKSSGVNSWDEAVLRAIDKTQTIPRDTDGTVVPEFDIEFRPKD